jgi:hypothetical protein
MYRRWKNSDQPKEEQTPARATANEAALKRDYRSGMSVVGTVEITTGHNIWEASDQRRISEAPLYGVAFLAFSPFRLGRAAIGAGDQVSCAAYLPAAGLRCTIKLAYQAADASHPPVRILR